MQTLRAQAANGPGVQPGIGLADRRVLLVRADLPTLDAAGYPLLPP